MAADEHGKPEDENGKAHGKLPHGDDSLEHFPEKWAPVFRRKCDKIKNLERFPIQLNRKAL
jgi:hypothetical protein